jgi:hypothetical protein
MAWAISDSAISYVGQRHGLTFPFPRQRHPRFGQGQFADDDVRSLCQQFVRAIGEHFGRKSRHQHR